jgi:lipopolysaccharide assembly outer membrane protein LptD (OstA)
LYNSRLKRILVTVYFFSVVLFGLQVIGQTKQNSNAISENQKQIIGSDTIINTSNNDTLVVPDSVKLKTKVSKPFIEDQIKYSAKDSMPIDWTTNKIYLYGDAHVTYQNIDLKAAYIELDQTNRTVYACGMKDTSGVMAGYPVFKQGSESYESHWMRYNFKTRKGFIHFVKSKQGEGNLIGDSTKRTANGHIHLKGATYSTCDLDHPHFYMKLTKAKSVPGDKIVAGYSYLVFADVPFPFLGIPFGFFPNSMKISSGILMPTYGDDVNRGFSLRNLGYYVGFNDYIDATVRTDIYSKGTWALYLQSNYKYRYHFSGGFNYTYNMNVVGEKGMPASLYSKSSYYNISWTHSKDGKANPYYDLNANVNFSSSTNYAQVNSNSLPDIYSNTKSSRINFNYRWPNSHFSISSSLGANQYSRTKTTDLELPNVALNMTPFYPFRREELVGETKWYEDIQFNYSANLKNSIKTYDSLLMTPKMFDNMNNGFQHRIPLSTNFKLGKSINISPSINYDGVLYTQATRHISNYRGTGDTAILYNKMIYGHSVFPGLNIGYNPKVYGMYTFQNMRVKQIRHVITPSVGFSITPDLSTILPSYKKTDTINGKAVTYSEFEKGMYGGPRGTSKSASITFSLRNTFEMKYLKGKDTAAKVEKLSLLRNLDFSTSYNIYTKILSDITMSTGTSLFSDKLSVQGGANFSPYAVIDSTGTVTKDFEWTKHRNLARFTSANLSLNTRFSSEDGKNNEVDKKNQDNQLKSKLNRNNNALGSNQEVDFDIPWSLTIDYSWSYYKSYAKVKKEFTQSSNFSGDLSLTKKWKISFSSGYDFTNEEFISTSFNIHRDLHCWEMRFSWVPFGTYTSYSFTINAKASMLRDLKWDKKSDFRDNFY